MNQHKTLVKASIFFIMIVVTLFITGAKVLARNTENFSSPKATFKTYLQACKELSF